MFRKIIVVIIVVISGILIFFCGYKSGKGQDDIKGGIIINNWSSAIGNVSKDEFDKTKVSYSIELKNENDRSIFVRSIKPTVNKAVKSLVTSKEIIVDVYQEIKPSETIEINGELVIDTKGLTKSEIEKIEPFITDIKVSEEDTFNIN